MEDKLIFIPNHINKITPFLNGNYWLESCSNQSDQSKKSILSFKPTNVIYFNAVELALAGLDGLLDCNG